MIVSECQIDIFNDIVDSIHLNLIKQKNFSRFLLSVLFVSGAIQAGGNSAEKTTGI